MSHDYVVIYSFYIFSFSLFELFRNYLKFKHESNSLFVIKYEGKEVNQGRVFSLGLLWFSVFTTLLIHYFSKTEIAPIEFFTNIIFIYSYFIINKESVIYFSTDEVRIYFSTYTWSELAFSVNNNRMVISEVKNMERITEIPTWYFSIVDFHKIFNEKIIGDIGIQSRKD